MVGEESRVRRRNFSRPFRRLEDGSSGKLRPQGRGAGPHAPESRYMLNIATESCERRGGGGRRHDVSGCH